MFATSVKFYQHHATKITCTVVTIASSDCEINPNDINISLSGAPMGVSGCPRPYFGSFCTSKRDIPKRQFRKYKKFNLFYSIPIIYINFAGNGFIRSAMIYPFLCGMHKCIPYNGYTHKLCFISGGRGDPPLQIFTIPLLLEKVI